jgi:hypothetical protein
LASLRNSASPKKPTARPIPTPAPPRTNIGRVNLDRLLGIQGPLRGMLWKRRWVIIPYEAPKSMSHPVQGAPLAKLYSDPVIGLTDIIYLLINYLVISFN